jgi:hypothetical protein
MANLIIIVFRDIWYCRYIIIKILNYLIEDEVYWTSVLTVYYRDHVNLCLTARRCQSAMFSSSGNHQLAVPYYSYLPTWNTNVGAWLAAFPTATLRPACISLSDATCRGISRAPSIDRGGLWHGSSRFDLEENRDSFVLQCSGYVLSIWSARISWSWFISRR